MSEPKDLTTFFQAFADALTSGDRQAFGRFFKLPIGLLYPSGVVSVVETETLGTELCKVTEEIQTRHVASLVATPQKSKVRDGAFPVKVRYSMLSRHGKEIGDFTSDYYCELQPDGTFLITFASCEMLKLLEER